MFYKALINKEEKKKEREKIRKIKMLLKLSLLIPDVSLFYSPCCKGE
jgi:hypothetical protein